jgi:glycerate-2-kinase
LTDKAYPQTRFVNGAQLAGHGRRELRADALTIAAAGLRAADPAAALERALRLDGDRLVVTGEPIAGLDSRRPAGETAVRLAGRRLFLVGAGKATIGMAAVLDRLLGPRFTDAAVVVKRGQAASLAEPLRHIEVLEASHPLPDESSLASGLRLLSVVRQAQPGDLLIGLVTGGSSALAVAPADGLTLADKLETNRLLLSSGADIVSMNNVRKHLSSIKGGLLARAFFEAAGSGMAGGTSPLTRVADAEVVNFAVSDVVGDPLDYFTDLTVPDRSTWAMARETCDRFGLWDKLPAAVADRLRRADPGQETPDRLPAVRTWVVADAGLMCTAAAEEARSLGYAPRLLGLDWEGEARDAGFALARLIIEAPPRTCLLAGGENTVSLGPTTGGGGGPSQEAALAAAHKLADAATAAVLCLDSDGTDGPTDAAGGLVDDLSAQAARAAGTDLPAALAAHTSSAALAALGDLIVTGPTGTNVNDLKIALRS